MILYNHVLPAVGGLLHTRCPDPAPARRPGLLRRLLERYRHRKAYCRLMELPDYLLEDVGLTRADVRAAHKGRRR